jgi:hypothetical protein
MSQYIFMRNVLENSVSGWEVPKPGRTKTFDLATNRRPGL